MNSKQLRQCLVEDSMTRHVFGGVMAIDQLPMNPQPDDKQVFIVNTQPASQPGAHWLAVYLPPTSQPVEFFDVLGQTPTTYGLPLIQFMNTQGSSYLFQTQSLQSQEAITCGHFCLYYLIHRVRGLSLDRIVQDFSPLHVRVNEQMVMEFVHKYFSIIV